MPGIASGPRIQEFNESASMLNGTDSSKMRGCDFNIFPVVAEPVNVTTSWLVTWSKIPFAEPQINCKLPSGKMPDATIFYSHLAIQKIIPTSKIGSRE